METAQHMTQDISENRLVVKDLRKSFLRNNGSEIWAVDRVSFSVPAGAITALIGPSGCGKSTILRMVGGLETPHSGVIALNGHPVGGPGPDRSMVFQSYTSFPWLTVQGNVEYPLKLAGKSASERRSVADHFVEMVGLQEFSSAYPSELSGGMRQRVALARALATSPDLLLLDEPFGALDAQTRWGLHARLLDIVRRTKMTCLMVTHDIEEALILASRIVVLAPHPGRIKSVVDPEFSQDLDVPTETLLALPEFAQARQNLLQMLAY